MSFGTIMTPVGTVGVACEGGAVTRVTWTSERGSDRGDADDALLAEAMAQLAAYFAGDLRRFDVPIDLGNQPDGTRAVLETLYGEVAYGQSVTYGELAARSATGIPARGIGAIMGSNPVPIIVPCHRVLAGAGLGGYSGGRPGQGLATKRWLLALEGVLPPALF